MIRFLRFLPFYVRAFWHWHKAQSFFNKNEYTETLRSLDRLRDIGVEPIALLVLRAETLNYVGQLQESYDLCIELMQGIHQRDTLAIDLQKYIYTYLLCIARHARSKGPLSRTGHIPHLKKSMLEEIDLETIPKYWRTNFPLKAHPAWNQLSRAT
ncbi:hypothetical protein [Pseudokordiimonas caeni]|uniref:hypothetical protein n=1 Tax=Pseudokordiimonas caeni TaxID=2997908 RepID=UPI002811DFC4|nr:hypothetical protein [Pseudokordiimonas caeni]